MNVGVIDVPAAFNVKFIYATDATGVMANPNFPNLLSMCDSHDFRRSHHRHLETAGPFVTTAFGMLPLLTDLNWRGVQSPALLPAAFANMPALKTL